jgi:hypothetical protein
MSIAVPWTSARSSAALAAGRYRTAEWGYGSHPAEPGQGRSSTAVENDCLEVSSNITIIYMHRLRVSCRLISVKVLH